MFFSLFPLLRALSSSLLWFTSVCISTSGFGEQQSLRCSNFHTFLQTSLVSWSSLLSLILKWFPVLYCFFCCKHPHPAFLNETDLLFLYPFLLPLHITHSTLKLVHFFAPLSLSRTQAPSAPTTTLNERMRRTCLFVFLFTLTLLFPLSPPFPLPFRQQTSEFCKGKISRFLSSFFFLRV